MAEIEVAPVRRTIKVQQDRRNINVRRSSRIIEVNHVGRRGAPGEAGPAGATGAQGPQGEQGEPGEPGAGDKNFVENFIAQSAVTVTHNLNKYPSVLITDSSGDEVECAVNHVSVNQLVATFSSSFTGRVVCN